MTTWTEAQIDRHLHLWEHRHGPDSPEAGIVRQLRGVSKDMERVTNQRDYNRRLADHQQTVIDRLNAHITQQNDALDSVREVAMREFAVLLRAEWDRQGLEKMNQFLRDVAEGKALPTTQETPHE